MTTEEMARMPRLKPRHVTHSADAARSRTTTSSSPSGGDVGVGQMDCRPQCQAGGEPHLFLQATGADVLQGAGQWPPHGAGWIGEIIIARVQRT